MIMWDEWVDTALQTQNSKFEPCRFFFLYLSVKYSPHNIASSQVSGEEVTFKFERQSGVRARDIRLSKQAALTTASAGPPPFDSKCATWCVNETMAH